MWDILQYLTGRMSEAVNKEKASGRLEDAVNRIGMYVAHATLAVVDAQLQVPDTHPSPLKATEIAKHLPTIRQDLHSYVNTRKGLHIYPEVRAAMAMAELALRKFELDCPME